MEQNQCFIRIGYVDRECQGSAGGCAGGGQIGSLGDRAGSTRSAGYDRRAGTVDGDGRCAFCYRGKNAGVSYSNDRSVRGRQREGTVCIVLSERQRFIRTNIQLNFTGTAQRSGTILDGKITILNRQGRFLGGDDGACGVLRAGDDGRGGSGGIRSRDGNFTG